MKKSLIKGLAICIAMVMGASVSAFGADIDLAKKSTVEVIL